MESAASRRFLIKEGLLPEDEPANEELNHEELNTIGEWIRQELASLGHADLDDETFTEIVGQFLAHFGVKGMRWGIRKDRPGVVGRTAEGSKLQPGKPGPDGKMRRTVRGPDGELHPLSKDGELVFNAALKLQSGGFGTLTNAEIKAYTDRIRLEDELVKTLNPPTPQPQGNQSSRPAPAKKPAIPVRVAKFIGKTLEKEAGNQASRVLNIVATQQINKQLEKRGVELPNKKKKKNN